MIHVSCSSCGAPIKRSPSNVSERNFCSKACQFKGYLASGNVRYKQGEGWSKCKKCAISFRQLPGDLANGKGRVYCSAKCRNLVRGRVDVICKECGSVFNVVPSRLSRTDSKTAFCSRACKDRHQSHSIVTTTGSLRGPKAIEGFNVPDLLITCRSSWEANYARYLNYLAVRQDIDRWEYEPDTFDFPTGPRRYTPDFKVFYAYGHFEYHEVKGWMDVPSKMKLASMERYFPNIEVIVIDRTAYMELQDALSTQIQHWEWSR